MGRKIYGVTVGTPINPQALIEKTTQAQQIEQNTKDIGDILVQIDELKQTGGGSVLPSAEEASF